MPAITCHQAQHPVAEVVFGEIANEEREVDVLKEGLIKMFAFDVSRAAREELIDPSFSDHHAPEKQLIGYQRGKKWLLMA
uniref:Uncharacterized protein n=1 Tax=Vitis vinifera TaxID=29760 RepID=F6HN59_VITVI